MNCKLVLVPRVHCTVGDDAGRLSAGPACRYRKLALKYHPDKDPGEEASSQFGNVCEAYDVLCNGTAPASATPALVPSDGAVRRHYEPLLRTSGHLSLNVNPAPGHLSSWCWWCVLQLQIGQYKLGC